MPATAFATAQTQVGLGIETAKGTPATTPLWLPVKAPKYAPKLTMITDDTLQGSMVETYDMVPGLRYDSHGWDSYPQLDTFPVLIRALLGSSDTLSAAPTSTTLAAIATAGATSISSTATIAVGSWIRIGTGVTAETHLTTAVSGAGPYSVTLAEPLRNGQASGAAVTGLTGHTFSLLNNAGQGNQPPTCTITDYDGDTWRQLTSGQLSKLTVKGTATGLVEYTCEWFADPATSISAPSVSFSTVEPIPGWSTQASIGGSPVGYLVDWEIDFDRKVQTIPALTGTQKYFMYFAGPLAVTSKLTVVEQAGGPELAAFEAGTTESLDLTVSDLSSGFAMRMHATDAKYTTGELDRSKQWVEAKLDVTLLPSAADATSGGVSPIKVQVGNSQATAY